MLEYWMPHLWHKRSFFFSIQLIRQVEWFLDWIPSWETSFQRQPYPLRMLHNALVAKVISVREGKNSINIRKPWLQDKTLSISSSKYILVSLLDKWVSSILTEVINLFFPKVQGLGSTQNNYHISTAVNLIEACTLTVSVALRGKEVDSGEKEKRDQNQCRFKTD